MGEITTLSDDHWATSEGVRDKIDVPHQGDPVDVERSIESATDTVQAWWQDATGGDYPADLPDPTTLADDHPLLVTATEYQAASEEHEKQTEQVQGSEGAGGRVEPKWVFLERRANSKFEDWVTRHGHDDTSGEGGTTSASAGTGQIGSLVDLAGGGS